MTDDTDRVLASIDEAIDGYVSEDWAVSGDAMRWRPDVPANATEGDPPDIVHTVEVSFNLDYPAGERLGGWSDAWQQVLGLHRAIERGEVVPQWSRPNTSRHSEPHGDDGGGWTDLGYTTDGGFVYARPAPQFNFGGLVPDPEDIRRGAADLGRAMPGMLAVATMGRALGAVGKSFKAQADRNHVQIAPWLYGDDYRRHRRSCRLCYPAGNPKPLPANGAEYRRRTRSRRRRNRR